MLSSLSPSLMIKEGLADVDIIRADDDREDALTRLLISGGAPPKMRLRIRQEDAQRFVPVVQKMVGFLNLSSDWDSYGSKPISLLALQMAVEVLGVAAYAGAAPPQVVPTSSGGVQLEWHHPQVDFELEVFPDHLAVSYERRDTGEIWEANPTTDRMRVYQILRELHAP